jgi:Bacterial Ig domain
MVTVTGANGFFATASTTLTATNPTQNPAFAYAKSAFCQLGTDPSPIIYGVPGGMFSAPGAVSINAGSGLIDVSASTVGGPYNITYTTPGPCAGSTTFAISIVHCVPGATLTDAITLDNGSPGKADPGDKITLTAKITNAQTADYEAVQMTLNNDPRVTFVPGSFKSTPVAVDDAYTATMNTLLTIVLGSGVLQNDFDEGILSVTAFSAMSAQGGAVLVNANGSFTYNPPVNFTGNDSFTYTITDSDLQTNVGTVRIRVQ